MGIVRKTKSVERLLDLFENNKVAKSATDMVEELKEDMNKTTVYRILDRLEADGIVHSFRGKDGLMWYAKCHNCSTEHHTDTHPHFQCDDCGKVECLSLEITIPTVVNHKIDTAEIILHGQCEDCLT